MRRCRRRCCRWSLDDGGDMRPVDRTDREVFELHSRRRRSSFKPEIAELICERLMMGQSLR
jgi:hypothetical protein